MNTNMTGFRWFSSFSLRPCALDESSLGNGGVKHVGKRDNGNRRRTVHLRI